MAWTLRRRHDHRLCPHGLLHHVGTTSGGAAGAAAGTGTTLGARAAPSMPAPQSGPATTPFQHHKSTWLDPSFFFLKNCKMSSPVRKQKPLLNGRQRQQAVLWGFVAIVYTIGWVAMDVRVQCLFIYLMVAFFLWR